MLKTVQILEQVLKISKPPYCLGQITYDFSLFVLLNSSALSVKMFFYKQNWWWSGPCAVRSWQLWGSGGLGVGWGGIGEAWVLTGRNGGYWGSSAAEVGVGRVGSGAHYSGELPAATSGAPTSPLLKYLKQVLFFIVIGNTSPPEIFGASPTLKYLTTTPLLMANNWNKSSPNGEVKYLKQILSS